MRQHVEWKNRTEQIQVEERAHTTHLNSLDIQHMALAKERERARKAMDAMRAAGFNFKGNPFGDLLGWLYYIGEWDDDRAKIEPAGQDLQELI